MTETDTPRPEYEIEIDVPVLDEGETLPVTLQKPGWYGMMRIGGASPDSFGDIETEQDVEELTSKETQAMQEFMETVVEVVTDIPDDVVRELSMDTMNVLVEACAAVLDDEDPRRLDGVDGRPADAPEFETTHSELLKD